MSTIAPNAASSAYRGITKADLGAPAALNENDKAQFALRGISEEKQQQVEAIYQQARSHVAAGDAQSFLLGLSPESLSLLQDASSLADTINPASVSEEGAANLLLAPHEAVDLNNDGIIEEGAGRVLSFPPVNAPQAVHEAWHTATEGMSDVDRLLLSGHIVLPLTLPEAGPQTTLGNMASADFDWKKLIADLRYANDLARPYNKPEISNMLDAAFARLQTELQNRNLA